MMRQNLMIAVLDDEPAYRRALSRLLMTNGHGVAAFASGAELVAQAAHAHFDCILLDLCMPGMSGFDVLAQLQHDAGSPAVIVITAQDDRALLARALSLKAFECHVKPVAETALLDAIDRAVRR